MSPDKAELAWAAQPSQRRAPLKSSERIWVVGVLALILFLVLSSQYVMLVYWHRTYGVRVLDVLAILAPFNLAAASILANYAVCVQSDPGHPPRGWQPDWHALGCPPGQGAEGFSTQLPLAKLHAGSPRFCKVCRAYKPPRAHHCRTCRRCVLRMDHHCPWIANCVGQRNYAAFLRFLASVDVACTMHLAMLTLRTADWWRPWGSWSPPTNTEMVLLLLNFGLGVPVLLLVGGFSLYHFYCACTNATTIEGGEKDRVETMVRRGRLREVPYPFNLGSVLRNLVSVFGANPLLWCWPALATRGDGLRFDVADDIDPAAQYLWPPKDPSKSYRRRLEVQRPGEAFVPPLDDEADGVGAQEGASQGSGRGAFTYGGEGFNPMLVPSNKQLRLRLEQEHEQGQQEKPIGAERDSQGGELSQHLRRRRRRPPSTSLLDARSNVPPWHPDYRAPQGDGGASGESSPAFGDEGVGEGSGASSLGSEVEDDELDGDEDAGEGGDTFAGESDSARKKGALLPPPTRSRVRRGSEGYEVRPKRFDVAFAVGEAEVEAEAWAKAEAEAESAVLRGGRHAAVSFGVDDAVGPGVAWHWHDEGGGSEDDADYGEDDVDDHGEGREDDEPGRKHGEDGAAARDAGMRHWGQRRGNQEDETRWDDMIDARDQAAATNGATTTTSSATAWEGAVGTEANQPTLTAGAGDPIAGVRPAPLLPSQVMLQRRQLQEQQQQQQQQPKQEQ